MPHVKYNSLFILYSFFFFFNFCFIPANKLTALLLSVYRFTGKTMEEKTFFRLFFVLTIAGVFLATSYGASEPEKKVSYRLHTTN